MEMVIWMEMRMETWIWRCGYRWERGNDDIQWNIANEFFIDLDFPDCGKYCGR